MQDEGTAQLPVYEVHERGQRTRLIVQAALAVLALGLFIWLVILLQGGAGATAGTLTLLGFLIVVLLVEVLLLEPIYHRLLPGPRGMPEKDEGYIIGCPGCGTVFTVSEEQLEAGSFACHNCGRQGFVKDHELNPRLIQDETCKTCGTRYMEYMEHSECPSCHTFNEY